MNAAEFLERHIPSTSFIFLLQNGIHIYREEYSAQFDRENPAALFRDILDQEKMSRLIDGYEIRWGYIDLVNDGYGDLGLDDGFSPKASTIFLPGCTRVFFDAQVERKDEETIRRYFPSLAVSDTPLSLIGEALGKSGNAYTVHVGDMNINTRNNLLTLYFSDEEIERFVLL